MLRRNIRTRTARKSYRKSRDKRARSASKEVSFLACAAGLRDMILLIDNYDSFTYNLVQRLGEMDARVDLRVFRNDKITLDEIADLKPSHIIISPGPCTPREAGISNDVLKRFAATVPTLGV